MQRTEGAFLPGESTQPTFPRRVRSSGRAPEALSTPPGQVAEPTAVSRALATERATGRGTANLGEYFGAVLQQFRDDTSIINPMDIAAGASDRAFQPTVIAQDLSAPAPMRVEVATPIGHSAIEDVSFYVDTLIQKETEAGDPNGEIQFQLGDFINRMDPPVRVVKVHLSPFRFPRIYQSLLYEYFYYGNAFLLVRFVPINAQTQAISPNNLFTFELRVDTVDADFVYLTPLSPTFILPAPLNVSGSIVFKFMRRDPFRTGMVPLPIPPRRIAVYRLAPAFATKFALVPYTDIRTCMGQIGVASQTLFQFVASATAPATPLSTALAGGIGIASNFQGIAGPPPAIPTYAFDTTYDTAAIPGGNEIIDIYLPRNAIAFTIRLSCLNPSRTNDLIPTAI